MHTPPMLTRILFISALALTSNLSAAETSSEDLLRQGLFEEEANHDFDKAAERYRAVVAAHDRQRALAATATYRLGEIARKKNDKDTAATAFRTVVARFPEQEDLARLSRENLTALGMPAPSAEALPSPAQDDPEQVEIERLKTLARNSPDLLDGATDNGWRPLHSAAAKGQMKVLAFLLENKGDPNGRTTREQLTPLQLAAIHGRLAAVNALLAAAAKVDDSFEMNPEIEKDLPPQDQRANKASGDWTALNLAILYDRREVARTLIKAGADLKKAGLEFSEYGTLTPLGEAIVLERDEIARELLEAGAPLTAPYPFASTPLNLAIHANPRMVPALLKAAADPNLAHGTERATPLQSAASLNRPDVAKLLLEAGADAKAVNAKGETALHSACSPEMVDLLVAAGADPNAKDKVGLTPLDAMVMRTNSDHSKALVALLAKGAVAEDPEALLRRAQPGMVAVVRERVVYPVKWQADAVLLTVAGQHEPGSWIERIETLPAPGSPPPSVAESIALFFPSQNSGQVRNLRIIRRDAEGRFQAVWDHTPQPDEKLPKELPVLEWGDIIEINLGSSSNQLPLSAFQERIGARKVGVRIGGVKFERKLANFGEIWLGDRSSLIALVNQSSRGRQIVQNPQQPNQNSQRAPRQWIYQIVDLPLIPYFVDFSRLRVIRQGVEKPIPLDLTVPDVRPFRLIEGDVIEGELKQAVREDLQEDGKQLLLFSDWSRGGIVNGPGLFSTLESLSQGFDGTGVRVFRGGDPAEEQRLDFSQILPEDVFTKELNREELLKVDALQPGDWIIVPPLPAGADEKARKSAESLRGRIVTVAAQLHPSQPPQPSSR